jgi:hypothetical protein
MDDDSPSGYERFWREVVAPLNRPGRARELVRAVEDYLAGCEHRDTRAALMRNVASCLGSDGRMAERDEWHRRLLDENPDSAFDWNSCAMDFAIDGRFDDPAALIKALDLNAIALEKARETRLWLRWVLGDRCRIATDAKRFDIVEAAMAAILDDWPCKCEIDVPFFEWDWLKRVPEGGIDPALRARYEATVAQVLAKRAEQDARSGAAAPEDAGSSQDAKGHPDEPPAWRDEDEGWHVKENWPEAPPE